MRKKEDLQAISPFVRGSIQSHDFSLVLYLTFASGRCARFISSHLVDKLLNEGLAHETMHACKILVYNPKFSIEEGLTELVNWYAKCTREKSNKKARRKLNISKNHTYIHRKEV